MVAALSSCTQGGHDQHSKIQIGAIGIGPTGGYSPEGMLTDLKTITPEERRVHLAARRGTEQALVGSLKFHYTPFVKMKQVPPHLPSDESFAAYIKKFALVNELDTVMRIWIIPHLHQQEVSVSFTTYARGGKHISSGVATLPFLVQSLKDPTARSSLSSWEETAYAATQEALATILIQSPPGDVVPRSVTRVTIQSPSRNQPRPLSMAARRARTTP